MKTAGSLLLLVLFPVCVSAKEEFELETYYPSPNGIYQKLSTDKFAVDVQGVGVASEYDAMQAGDAHIGRALILGPGGGSGFAFDENAKPEPGTLLLSGMLGIGTPHPGEKVEIYGGGNLSLKSSANDPGDLIFKNSADIEYGRVYALADGLNLRANSARANDIFINHSNGNVGINKSNPTAKLHVEAPLTISPLPPLLNVGTSQTVSSGDFSSAIGNGARATNADAVAIGAGTLASGARSTALGYQTTASGNYSTAIGTAATASGLRSVAIGLSNNNPGAVTQDDSLGILGGRVGIGTGAPGALLDIGNGSAQCCASQTPNLSLAQNSSGNGEMSWLQFHNANEAEAYIRLAGGGTGARAGARRLEIGDSQGVNTSLKVSGGISFNPATTKYYPTVANPTGVSNPGTPDERYCVSNNNTNFYNLGQHSFCALGGLMQSNGSASEARVFRVADTWYVMVMAGGNEQCCASVNCID